MLSGRKVLVYAYRSIEYALCFKSCCFSVIKFIFNTCNAVVICYNTADKYCAGIAFYSSVLGRIFNSNNRFVSFLIKRNCTFYRYGVSYSIHCSN